MNKILKISLISLVFGLTPAYAFSHVQHSEVTKPGILAQDNIATADLSAFENCNGNQSCEIVRKEIIKILEDLIKELLVEIEKEKERLEQENQEEIETEDEDDEDISKEEEDRIKYASRLSETPLNKNRSKRFSVRNGEVEMRSSTHPVFQELWKLTKEAFPEEFRKQLQYFKVVNKPEMENAAYVEVFAKKEGNKLTTYSNLTLNIDDLKVNTFSQKRRTMKVIVHELVHVMAFSEDQLNYFTREDNCRYFYSEELGACSLSTSYYTHFHREFWDDEFYDLTDEYLEDGDYEIIEDYFDENKDRFVTEYAVTSPDEDLAESMLFFFVEPRKLDTSLEKSRKINSFYEFPELIEVRNYIHRNLFYLI